MLCRTVTQEHFHIASVWCRTVIDFGRKTDAAHFFGAQGIFHVGQAGAIERYAVIDMHAARRWRHEQVPKTRSLGACLFFFNDLQHFPAVAYGLLGIIIGDAWTQKAFIMVADTVPPICLLVVEIEIHDSFLFQI